MKATAGLHAPKKAGDAGYDLYAGSPPEPQEDGKPWYVGGGWLIEPRSHIVLETSAAVEIPDGYCGIIIGRSSLNTKGLVCCVGLVDSGYRGLIKVLLQNITDHHIGIHVGDRVAQMVLVPYGNFPVEVVDFERLTPSERGSTGFGSTGQ